MVVWLALLAIGVVIGGIGAAIYGVFAGWRLLVASRFTPAGHVRVGEYRESAAWRELNGDGYSVEPDWRSDAASRVNWK